MLTVEELLRPRYKVIADYPGCPYEVGTVLYVDPDGELYSPIAGYSRTVTKVMECDVDKYPANFQPLPWWSDREISDMPEYVKVIREDCIKDTGTYCKVYKWSPLGDKWPEMKGQVGAELEGYSPLYLGRAELNFPGQVYGRLNATHLEPATFADYEQYNQQKEGNRE